MSAQRSGHALAKAKQRKETTYQGYYNPAVYTLKTLAFSTWGNISEDTPSFYKDLAHHHVIKRNDWIDEK